MNKIHRYTRLLIIMSSILAITVISATCVSWLFDIFPNFLVDYVNCYDFNMHKAEIMTMPLLDRIFGLLVDSMGFILIYYAIIHFGRLMKQFQVGDFFSINVIQQLHKLSKIALYWVLFTPLRGALLSIIISLHKGPGNRIVSLSFGSTDIINIFIFVCFVLITLVMQEGCKLKQEQDFTI